LRRRSKKPDIEVFPDSRGILVEVTTPGSAANLVEKPGEIVTLKNRASGQILEEYSQNFEQALSERIISTEPIIIALDLSHPEISQEDIEQAVVVRRLKGGEAITGVLWFARATRSSGRICLIGSYIENPNGKNPLTDEEKKKLDFTTNS